MERPQRRNHAGQRIHLRPVQFERLRHRRPQATHPKRRRPLLDPDQPPPHQRLQRRRRQILAPQHSQRQLPAARRQLRQNRLLLLGQRRQPRLGNQHREPLRPPRVPLHCRGLPRNPLLAQHSRQHRQRRRRRRPQRRHLHRLTLSQPRQHPQFQIDLFLRQLPPPPRPAGPS